MLWGGPRVGHCGPARSAVVRAVRAVPVRTVPLPVVSEVALVHTSPHPGPGLSASIIAGAQQVSVSATHFSGRSMAWSHARNKPMRPAEIQIHAMKSPMQCGFDCYNIRYDTIRYTFGDWSVGFYVCKWRRKRVVRRMYVIVGVTVDVKM